MMMQDGQPDNETAPVSNQHPKNNGGSVRPWELVLVSVLVMAMIGGAATAIVLGTRGDPLLPNSGIDPVTGKVVSIFPLPTPPEPSLFQGGDEEEYQYLKEQLQERGAPFESVLTSLSATTISGLPKDSTDPIVRAAVWLTSQDTTNAPEFALFRFALASLYYALGGDNWTDKSGWLSPSRHYCDWHGVECCPELLGSVSCTYTDFYKFIQLDLFRNNLVGTIPITIGLFTDLQSIFFNENTISGNLPTHFGELPKLHRVYLQHNLFEGRIPSRKEIDKGNLIGTYFILVVV